MEAIKGRRIELTSPLSIAPNDNGMMAFKPLKSFDLLNIEIEDGGEILELLVGKNQIKPNPDKSWAELINNLKVTKDSYITILFKNKLDVQKTFTGAIYVDNELDLKEVAKNASPTTSVNQRVNTIRKVGVKTFSTKQPKVINLPKNSKQSIISRQSSGLKTEETIVLPQEEGKCSILLLKGHAYALIKLLTYNVPLLVQFKNSIVSQLDFSLYNKKPINLKETDSEALIILDAKLAYKLFLYIVGKAPRFNNNEIDEIVTAIELGLNKQIKEDDSKAMIAVNSQ